jgi:uncharacterized protein YndB with AHSA1/START domain
MSLEPVTKRLHVPLSPDEAFSLFTEGVGRWWPVETHSIFGSRAKAFFEAAPGGRIGERDAMGREEIWGEVRICERPNRLVFSWHPGRDPATAQDVEVRFAAQGKGAVVDLEHRGWERLENGRAEELRESYETGWDHVFCDRFGRAACR